MFTAIRLAVQDYSWNKYWNAPTKSLREAFWYAVYRNI